jgi:DNA-binding protein YbaB
MDGMAELRRGIDGLQQRAAGIAAALREAQQRSVTARSTDGAVEASAAGQRLTGVELTPSAAALPHDALVASVLEAAQGALRGSEEAIRVAAANTMGEVSR